jgi:DNA-binding transcriptional regulator YiaG
MDLPLQAAWAAALHGPIDVGEGQLVTEADIQAAWATPVREAIDLAGLTAIMARWKQQHDAVQQAEALLPPSMTLWQFSVQCLGFSPKELRLETTHTQWLNRYNEYISRLLQPPEIDGEKVQEARDDLDLKVFARLLGISHDTLERIERNDHVSPKTTAKVIRLCKKHRNVDVQRKSTQKTQQT